MFSPSANSRTTERTNINDKVPYSIVYAWFLAAVNGALCLMETELLLTALRLASIYTSTVTMVIRAIDTTIATLSNMIPWRVPISLNCTPAAALHTYDTRTPAIMTPNADPRTVRDLTKTFLASSLPRTPSSPNRRRNRRNIAALRIL